MLEKLYMGGVERGWVGGWVDRAMVMGVMVGP